MRKLQDANPGVPVVEDMQLDHNLRVIDGRELFVKEKTCSMTVAIHAGYGPTVLRQQRFATMTGTDDVEIIGGTMLKLLRIDVYNALEELIRGGHNHHIPGDDDITSDDTCTETEVRAVGGGRTMGQLPKMETPHQTVPFPILSEDACERLQPGVEVTTPNTTIAESVAMSFKVVAIEWMSMEEQKCF